MGLLNHDDDYVSPFDDGMPSYIDPSKRADYLSEIVDTKHQMREAAEQRGKQWAEAARKSTTQRTNQTKRGAVPQQARAQQARTQQRNTLKQYRQQQQHTHPQGHGTARRANPVIARQQTGKQRKKSRAFVWSVVALVLLFSFGEPIAGTIYDLIDSGTSPWHSSTTESSSTSDGNSSDSDNDYSDDAAQNENSTAITVEKTGDVLDASGESKGTITIASAATGPADYSGNPTVIVTFKWTNTSNKALTFDSIASPEVYQNGLELRQISFSTSTEVPGYSYESPQTKVDSGENFTTTLAYTLRDTTTPIYVQSDRDARYSVSPLIISAFTPGSGSDWTQVESNTITISQAASSDRAGMTTIGDSEYTKFSYAFAGVQRGPTDAMDAPSAIVALDWINESANSESFSYYGDVSVMQHNVELDRALYLDDPDGYVNGSPMLNIKPGVKATAQYAVKLNDESSPITVTFTPYDGEPVSKTFQLK